MFRLDLPQHLQAKKEILALDGARAHVHPAEDIEQQERLTLPLPVRPVGNVVAAAEDQDVLVLFTQCLDNPCPPGEAAFLLGFSSTLVDLTNAAGLVTDDHIHIGEGRRKGRHGDQKKQGATQGKEITEDSHRASCSLLN